MLDAGPVDLEHVKEEAQSPSQEVDHHNKRVGGSHSEGEWQADQEGIEIYTQLAHLLHESFGAVIEFSKFIGLCNFGIEGFDVDGGVCFFVFDAFALAILEAAS